MYLYFHQKRIKIVYLTDLTSFLIDYVWIYWTLVRDVISVFSRGGQNFDRVPRRGGAKYEEKIFCRQKHKKVTIFQIQGGGQMPPLPPPE